MHKNKSVDVHRFAMVPRADIPRSAFRMQKTLKTAFDAGYLVPIYCEEVLPGDSFNVSLTAFCRMATPIYPVMDNMHLSTFFFFVPNRIVWSNWKKFMGEQNSPADSISFTVPTITSDVGGYAIGTVYDFMGLPTLGQVGGANQIVHSALPLRAYNLIWKEWFRDENLQNTPAINSGDGPDSSADYPLRRRGKRHDYFTACLPWTQKSTAAVTIPLGTRAPISGLGLGTAATFPNAGLTIKDAVSGAGGVVYPDSAATTGTTFYMRGTAAGAGGYPDVYADLASATGATINALRLAFQTQKLLERDARGGTRYTELVRSHFGVISPDARLQRPEYLGGGRSPIVINPVAQTSASNLTGGSTPLANLSGMGTALARHGFSQSFTEHGYIIGLACVDADLTYQQGLRRHWSRSTRYDFYFPAFAMLGEQSVLNKEIYARGDANDNLVFGYQERWAEYRYNPSEITGLMRSTAASTIHQWHLSQQFTALPTLNSTFIESTPPVSRVVAVGASANGQQFLFDGFYDGRVARPMPLYSVPGLIDHL